MRQIAILLLVSLVACGAPGTTEPDEEPSTTTVPDLPDGLTPEIYGNIVADAASRADVGESDVELVSIDAEDFNDASLGCPEEGLMYAQVITPGFRVVVTAASAEYDYRVAAGDPDFRLCEDPGEPSG